MRISTQQIFQSNLQRMQENSVQQAKTQEQLSTGKRVNRPSDDPVAASRMLQLGQELKRTEQYQRNIDFAQNRLEQEDSTLGSMSDLLVRVRELAVQAGNGSMTDEDRSFIAAELEQRLEQLVGLANSKDSNGQYMFGGFDGDNAPYQMVGADEEPAQMKGYWAYKGSPGDNDQRTLKIDDTVNVKISDRGPQIFGNDPEADSDPATTFMTVQDLVKGLKNPPESQDEFNGLIEDTLSGLDDAQSRILEVRSQVGARLNTIESTREFHSDSALLTEGVLSEIRDLDYGEAIPRFTQQQTILQAAQQSYALVSRMSLFDRL